MLNNRGWSLKEMLFIIAILICILLLVAILINNLSKGLEKNNHTNENDKSNTYKQIEQHLLEASKKYKKNHKEKTKILSDVLLEEDYIKISELTSKNDICEGYVIIENNKYTPYILCTNYKTKGYENE